MTTEKDTKDTSGLIRSPLRYPGAKLRLLTPIAETLKLNSLKPKLFCEPLAGGLSVSLRLLSQNLVENIAIGEKDPLVAGFWKTVFKDTEWLVEQVERLEITVENWKAYRDRVCRTNRESALACIFLNRTSFSGILADSAGPIGGPNQASDYKIDCRFNKEDVIKRIRQASELKDRVKFVNRGGWKSTIKKVKALDYKPQETFFYFDPPFYAKADRLYRYYFEDQDHLELCRFLNTFKRPWLLSYDNAPEIVKMYSSGANGTNHVEHLYSIASAGTRQKTKELFITNLKRLPASAN
ncbi:MAG TPA: DNA adenine methylase [Pyrinomonadaceae bacterium]|nr:DNA adenine methylase [Pyrinomonadaceae bacterium]